MIPWVKEAFPGLPIVVMGHSVGGLIATHWGIRRVKGEPAIRGFILSSPYYVNRAKVPRFLEKVAWVLAMVLPKGKLPLEDIVSYTTRDQEILARHQKDQEEGIKGRQVSNRHGIDLLKAQKWVPENISRWSHPMLALMAGDDRIADTEAARKILTGIPEDLLTERYYPENYHENFNEPNREQVFEEVSKWLKAL
jgi:lysophospholipase